VTVDVERLLSAWLRSRSEILTLIENRIYTEVPRQVPPDPFMRITQIGGAPVFSRPLYFDEAVIQFDFYGGPKATARLLMDTTRDLLAGPFYGVHVDVGTVTSVRFAETAYVPDDMYDPPRPRWASTASVFTHP
jgi:hypothetical protein